jgi:hypothetical protein
VRAALALVALAAGCAMAPPAPVSPGEAPVRAAPAAHTADRLLASLARLLAMDESGLNAEIARRRDELDANPGDLARVEAAMAAAMAPSPDDELVSALVAPVLAAFPPAEPDLRAMAGFLQGMASERRKLREGLAAASAKSREDHREAYAQRLRAQAQQERADRLQAKLEALTNLEKSLANRPHADDTDRRPR